ncbi:Holliday junction DNA helicase RuvA [Mycoplasmopsis maculosa]|uniref:Holliday junction DNA helicase RuvA n=1 Tax=Mycoplasmopsis maculosa TaxID=114885 RepID=A0A449B579_9BACT|nr:hypothetical protein [Mycoplasmopsis maculosa]VEU75764.1 Holliday junction DNA helicase RuvA [Mycoplasmopsis maculosa]
MKFYQYGTVYKSRNNKIILDAYGTGYLINVINANNFNNNEKQKVYIIEVPKTNEMYGFKEYHDYLIFKSLLDIKELQHYRAIKLLREANSFEICKAILEEDSDSFKKWGLQTSLALKIISRLGKIAIFIIDNYLNKKEETDIQTNLEQNNKNIHDIDLDLSPFNM